MQKLSCYGGQSGMIYTEIQYSGKREAPGKDDIQQVTQQLKFTWF